MQYYEVITPAASEPLSLSDAKSFLRVDTDADDDLISTIISAVRLSAEKITNRLLQTQTQRVSEQELDSNGCMIIKRSPLTSIDSVETWNGSAFAANTNYFLIPGNGYSYIKFTVLPSIYTDVPYSIKVQFDAGYASIPDDLLQAMKNHVAFMYENRGDVQAIGGIPIPPEVNMIYRQYRIISTYA